MVRDPIESIGRTYPFKEALLSSLASNIGLDISLLMWRVVSESPVLESIRATKSIELNVLEYCKLLYRR
jgi:hypothetical protein